MKCMNKLKSGDVTMGIHLNETHMQTSGMA